MRKGIDFNAIRNYLIKYKNEIFISFSGVILLIALIAFFVVSIGFIAKSLNTALKTNPDGGKIVRFDIDKFNKLKILIGDNNMSSIIKDENKSIQIDTNTPIKSVTTTKNVAN